jgi:membrane protease YdiL (CAAX protease family)
MTPMPRANPRGEGGPEAPESQERPDASPQRPFLEPFLALTAMGLPGVVSLVPVLSRQLEAVDLEKAPLPTGWLIALALVQSSLVLAGSVALGLATAPRVGFTSLLVDRLRDGAPLWRRLRPRLPLAVVLGLAFGGAVVALDAVLLPMTGVEPEALQKAALEPVTRLLVGLLYGGIVEELLMRWALMSLVVWLGWRFLGRRTPEGRPSSGLVWFALLVVALLFGLGHLPALASFVPLTPMLVARTIALNALGGLVFGWVFWRQGLEAAMASHASAHVAFAVIALVMTWMGA